MTYIMSYEVISLLCYQNRNKAYTILFTIGNHANFHTGSTNGMIVFYILLATIMYIYDSEIRLNLDRELIAFSFSFNFIQPNGRC